MSKNLLVFTKKFDVPDKLKNHIHKILSEKEILILNHLAENKEIISDITNKFPEIKLSLIEALYKKGYLIKQLKDSKEYYKSNTFDQIFKRFVNYDPKYHSLSFSENLQFQEYFSEIYLKNMRESEKPVYRVIPIEKTIQNKTQLIPYYQAIYYLQKASPLAVTDCICRTTRQKCNKPRKVCLALGEQANFFIERGLGEKIEIEKGLEILNSSVENGLVHSINNRENPNFLCNCCECCCAFVQGLKKYGIFTSIGKSGFVAVMESKLCNQCRICVEKCIFEAISDEKEKIKFNNDKCFGCGICAYNCPTQAIKLVLKTNF